MDVPAVRYKYLTKAFASYWTEKKIKKNFYKKLKMNDVETFRQNIVSWRNFNEYFLLFFLSKSFISSDNKFNLTETLQCKRIENTESI